MKHILNNIDQFEKQRILEQHSGGMIVNNKKFFKLLESKLGSVKPLLNEQMEQVPVDWTNFPCVASHPGAKKQDNSDGTSLIYIGNTIYYNNGRKMVGDKMLEYTCKDPEFVGVKIKKTQSYQKPSDTPKDIKGFQNWVVNTKKDTRVLGQYSIDGRWGPRTQTAWNLYKKEYQAANPGK